MLTQQNKLGDTPLHGAAWKGQSEIISMILEKGNELIFSSAFRNCHMKGPTDGSKTRTGKSLMILQQRAPKLNNCYGQVSQVSPFLALC